MGPLVRVPETRADIPDDSDLIDIRGKAGLGRLVPETRADVPDDSDFIDIRGKAGLGCLVPET